MAGDGMIFVTFHKKPNNVYAYDAVTQALLSSTVLAPGKHSLEELRGIYLAPNSGGLIVVDGSKKSSRIYLYPSTSATTYGPPQTLISFDKVNSIDHPFAVAFGPADSDGKFVAYVSNQDSNVVASFKVDLSKADAKPESTSSFLSKKYPSGTFLEGTFVASAVNGLPGLALDPIPVSGSDGGLGVIMGPDILGDGGAVTYKVQHSVRDVAVANGWLLVVDEADGVVRIYDASSGDYQGASTVVGAAGAIMNLPTHLFVTSSEVYVTFANQVYSAPLPAASPATPALAFAPLKTIDKGSLSGLVIGPDGSYYLANRTEMTILKYSPDFQTLVWTIQLAEEPEFLLYVAD